MRLVVAIRTHRSVAAATAISLCLVFIRSKLSLQQKEVLRAQDEQLADKMALLRSHGVTRDPNKMQGGSQGPWYYQQIELGFNYRMTELQAALGNSQMERLDEFVEQRHRPGQSL